MKLVIKLKFLISQAQTFLEKCVFDAKKTKKKTENV